MKTVVVTGASQGLGQSIAYAFLKTGWHVIGTGRSVRPADLDEKIDYKQFDASSPEACSDFWAQLGLESGAEICLVNNAGSYVGGGLLETDPEDYDKQMQSNYFAGVYMTRGLIKNVEQARVINIISSSALSVDARSSAYGAAKAAAQYFFQSLQQEFPAEKYSITNFYPSNIASHGANPDAIDPNDLATLVVEQAENQASYYLRDVTAYPIKRKS